MMKQFGLLLCLFSIIACNQNSSESQNKTPAYDLANTVQFNFNTIGIEGEDNTKLVSKIEVSKVNSSASFQTLEGFEAKVQKNEEVIVEDLNFDGFMDIRLMQYLPTDESIAYFYWIYDDTNKRFVRSETLEKSVFSPVLDTDEEFIISQWRKNDGSWGSDFYEFTEALNIKLVKQEINTPQNNEMFQLILKENQGGVMTVVKDSIFKPSNYLPF